jgi:hypothetical protein
MSATLSAVAVWEISAVALTPVLFREVFDVVSEGTGSPAGRKVEDFAADGRAAGTVVVDGAACSEGRRTTSDRGSQYEKGRASLMCNTLY